MNFADLTREEVEILQVFRDLLDDVSYGWAFALGESPKEHVICMYKEDGLWNQYVIQNGHRYDEELNCDLYDLCLTNLKRTGTRDERIYLSRNFELALADVKKRRK